jgi:hypothetical protein
VARSGYIYAVIDNEGALTAVFTVKHEMVTWLRRLPDLGHIAAIRRHRDGGSGEVVDLDIKELLA